jgi:hypothetical protein
MWIKCFHYRTHVLVLGKFGPREVLVPIHKMLKLNRLLEFLEWVNAHFSWQ